MDALAIAFTIYLFIVGGAMFVAGVFVLKRNWCLAHGEHIGGMLVGWHVKHDSMEGTSTYHHRVRYRDASEREAEFVSEYNGSGKVEEIGATLPLRLISGNPDQVEVSRPFWLIAAPLIMMAFGGTVVAVPFLTR